MDFSKLWKHLTWPDFAVIALVAGFVIFYTALTSNMVSLPSPVYGGDLYYQLGSVNHIRYGGALTGGSNLLDSEPGYLILYGALVAGVANLSNMGSIAAMMSFSTLLGAAALFMYYAAFNKLFKDKILSLTLTLLFALPGTFLILKYGHFTNLLVAPAFFFTFYYFHQVPSFKRAILPGILYGLAAISHTGTFIPLSLFIVIYFLYTTFASAYTRVEGQRIFSVMTLLKTFKEHLPQIAILIGIGLLLAQLYWFRPLFVHHLQTSPNYTLWNNMDFSSTAVKISFLASTLKGMFASFSTLTAATRSLLSLAAILFIVGFKKTGPLVRFIKILFITTLLVAFHYFLTMPLLGTNFAPASLVGYVLTPFAIFTAVFSLQVLGANIKKYRKPILLGLSIVLLLTTFVSFSQRPTEDQWIKNAAQPLPSYLQAFHAYALENTDVNDVFLTSNELGFALNGVTGRKLVTSRRAQNSPFTDTNQRALDAAIMLYGNNDAKRRELLQQYSVDYLYWDFYWLQSEYQYSEEGQITNTFDPLLVFDTPEARAELEQYDIQFQGVHTWVDPALRGSNYRTFDLLYIFPTQLNPVHPWVAALDPFLEKVWAHAEGGQEVVQVYRVKL